MNVIEKLASSLGRRDEIPNQELAKHIVTENAFVLINEQLLGSPANQLPMYAEKAMPIINENNKAVFIKTLTARLDDIDKDTKRKRVEKVMAKFRSK